MDNKDNIHIYNLGNNARLLDPNFGHQNIPTENLSISVDLYVMKRNRSFIGMSEDNGVYEYHLGKLPNGSAPFFEGSETDGTFSFTTDFTEVSNDDHSGRESLGITSLDIQFNSAYMPLVNIQLTDIRGRMHEQGADSPYNGFFTMPYPIFKLVIKGYYGKPVEYMLHLHTFNSTMDSRSGNYHINCNFIGYTYAYLSDMLLGYLKAVPYTDVGKQIKERKELEDPDFITFDEMYEYAKSLNKAIIKLKEDDEDVQAIGLGYQVLHELQDIKSELLYLIRSTDDVNYEVLSKTGGFLFLIPDNLKLTDFFGRIKNIRERIEDLEQSETLSITPSLFKKVENTNYFSKVLQSHFLDGDLKPLEKYSGGYRGVVDILRDEKVFNKLVKGFQSVGPLGQHISLFHYEPMVRDINIAITELNKSIEKFKESVADKFFKKIEDLQRKESDGTIKTFEFNIQNYFKVLCDHVDMLMESIRTVSKDAEDDPIRNAELKMTSGKFDIDERTLEENETIYAFPEYIKKKDGGIPEAHWIGNDHPDIGEVGFVKQLYDGLVKIKKEEEDFKVQLENYSRQWYSINAYDSIHFTGLDSPWASVGNMKLDNIIEMVLWRAMTFLSISVKNPTQKEVQVMGQLEANNLFLNIQNDDIKSELSNFLNKKTSQITKAIRNKLEGEELKMIETDGSDDKYIDSYKEDEDKPYSKFIPLVPDYSTKDTRTDIEVREKQPTDYFFGNQNGSLGLNKYNDGASYLEILTPETYDTSYSVGNVYGQRILEKSEITNDKTFNYSELNDPKSQEDVLFNGRWGTNEFLFYKSDDFEDDINFYTYFYEREDASMKTMFKGGDTLNYIVNEDGETESLPNVLLYGYEKMTLSGEEVPFSLLGSEYYYNQSDYGRAYLYLHSIPFKGLVGDYGGDNTIFNEKIINLFNQKSSFIEVPYSWVLLIGGTLYRNEIEEIIKFRDDDDDILLPFSFEKYKKTPSSNQLLKQKDSEGSQSYHPTKTYLGIDEVLKNLPISIKEKFIFEFKAWVNSGEFRDFISQYEIFNYQSKEEWEEFWLALPNMTKNEISTHPMVNMKAWEKYEIIEINKSPEHLAEVMGSENYGIPEQKQLLLDMLYDKDKGSYYNFNLKLRDGFSVKSALDFLRMRRIILNSTWRIWSEDAGPISTKREYLDEYIISFFKEFNSITKEKEEGEERSFGMTNSSDIYLSIYKNIKSIKDKWITGNDNENKLPFRNLIETFKFIDRGYNNIGKDFKINPLQVSSLLTSNYNDSLYSHFSKILTRNNFDFIALPNFANFSNDDEMREIFETFSYSSMRGSVEPSFVCMYIGERSQSLENGDGHFNDTFNFTETGEDVPSDFDNVPAILVRYGDLNQSIFKDIQLSQSEFSETNESLAVTDAIANSYNNINSIGQNLYNVYTNRAYNSTIEMMGNAMIQPFMYFQLQNIPMFRGAYVIVKVEHSLVDNHMTTKITGNRVKKGKTKLLDKVTIFNNLIGNFGDINVEGANLENLIEVENNISSETLTTIYNPAPLDYGKPENELQLTENFKLKEFSCSYYTKPETPLEYRRNLQILAQNLEVLRSYFGEGTSIIINSGYRSKIHNDKLIEEYKKKNPDGNKGPSENSKHLVGMAADIVVKVDGDIIQPTKVAKAIIELIRKGEMKDGAIGIYNSFVHYDIRDKELNKSYGARWDFSDKGDYWERNGVV